MTDKSETKKQILEVSNIGRWMHREVVLCWQ